MIYRILSPNQHDWIDLQEIRLFSNRAFPIILFCVLYSECSKFGYWRAWRLKRFWTLNVDPTEINRGKYVYGHILSSLIVVHTSFTPPIMPSSVVTATVQSISHPKPPLQRSLDQAPRTSNRDDFFWSYTEEPHRTRRQAIINAHPEVIAPDPKELRLALC